MGWPVQPVKNAGNFTIYFKDRSNMSTRVDPREKETAGSRDLRKRGIAPLGVTDFWEVWSIGPIRLFAYEAGPIKLLVCVRLLGGCLIIPLIFPFWRLTRLTNKPALSFSLVDPSNRSVVPNIISLHMAKEDYEWLGFGELSLVEHPPVCPPHSYQFIISDVKSAFQDFLDWWVTFISRPRSMSLR